MMTLRPETNAMGLSGLRAHHRFKAGMTGHDAPGCMRIVSPDS